jgi:hypothetical protein
MDLSPYGVVVDLTPVGAFTAMGAMAVSLVQADVLFDKQETKSEREAVIKMPSPLHKTARAEAQQDAADLTADNPKWSMQ